MGRNIEVHKKSFYIPSRMLQQMEQEAQRTDRSLSHVVRLAWNRAHGEAPGDRPLGWRGGRRHPPPGEGGRHKVGISFPRSMAREIDMEALRQGRTLSWILQRAWDIAREEIRRCSEEVERWERKAGLG